VAGQPIAFFYMATPCYRWAAEHIFIFKRALQCVAPSPIFYGLSLVAQAMSTFTMVNTGLLNCTWIITAGLPGYGCILGLRFWVCCILFTRMSLKRQVKRSLEKLRSI